MTKYKHLFGPVPSRRLGKSLGVDLIPLKTCTLNCVYCECGATNNLTITRKEYVPTAEVINELTDLLQQKPRLDYITFSGGGEPTLATNIKDILSFLKKSYPQYNICLLTNGTLFTAAGVRAAVLQCDLIIPSLDAATKEIFAKINRPDNKLNIEKIIQGLIDLRKEFKGKLYLEVFILPGYNDSAGELKAIKEAALKINPDLVQLNSLDRLGTIPDLKQATKEELKNIAAIFKPLPVEIISRASTGNPDDVLRHATRLSKP